MTIVVVFSDQIRKFSIFLTWSYFALVYENKIVPGKKKVELCFLTSRKLYPLSKIGKQWTETITKFFFKAESSNLNSSFLNLFGGWKQ